MPLLSLPQEIILLIASKLASASDIVHFLQANHVLYSLLLHELYKRDIRTTSGQALSFYAFWGYDARVREMLALGANVDVQNPRWRDRTPVMLAISRREMTVVRTLIEHGADLNFIEDVKHGPLEIAILNASTQDDDLSLIELLLDCGADVNLRGYQGRTPLYTAILSHNPAIVTMLLARGADVHVREDKYQRTPLQFAVGENGTGEIQRILRDAGA